MFFAGCWADFVYGHTKRRDVKPHAPHSCPNSAPRKHICSFRRARPAPCMRPRIGILSVYFWISSARQGSPMGETRPDAGRRTHGRSGAPGRARGGRTQGKWVPWYPATCFRIPPDAPGGLLRIYPYRHTTPPRQAHAPASVRSARAGSAGLQAARVSFLACWPLF